MITGFDLALPGSERTVLVRVDRIGKRTLDGNRLTLENRTNYTTITLTDEQAERWRVYMLTGKILKKKAS